MIYLDNAATTQMHDDVQAVMAEYETKNYFNVSAAYKPAVSLSNQIDTVRADILKKLNGSGAIIFTGCATEANNLAIYGSAKNKQATYIFSGIEHPSVYNVAQDLKNRNYNVLYINTLPNGSVDIKHLKTLLDSSVSFVSVMAVNNETGAINDIKSIVKLVKSVNPSIIVHSDCVQALGKIEIDLNSWGVDLCSFSAHKINGPKGVGALYIKSGVNINAHILGGGQEFGLRSGTVNTAGIMGFKKALDITLQNFEMTQNNLLNCKTEFLNFLNQNITDYKLNSSLDNSVNNTISLSFKGLRGEVIMHMLSEQGIIIGTGSACSSKHSDNRVLSQMGLNKNYIEGSVRISFGMFNTVTEAMDCAKALVIAVNTLKGI
ncbi:MAG: cysteine desulfurase family protein [Clostridia bacterium]|nr:cysteine desulfurase family protein [Clostridia bacterium]